MHLGARQAEIPASARHTRALAGLSLFFSLDALHTSAPRTNGPHASSARRRLFIKTPHLNALKTGALGVLVVRFVCAQAAAAAAAVVVCEPIKLGQRVRMSSRQDKKA